MLSSKVEGPIVERLSADLLAGTMIALMLLPQAVAFATLAGLPPQAGLYASLAPLLAYALLGSSPLLSVGPVAVSRRASRRRPPEEEA
jgi:SulP family sulfate permease